MNQKPGIDAIIRSFVDRLPREILESGSEVRRNLGATLRATLSQMELVTQEEFEVQAELLSRTRLKLEALERRVAELESKLADSDPTDA